MPPTFGSSFYKDKDLRLEGEEEDEEYRVAEGSLALRERAPPLPPCMTLFLPFPTVCMLSAYQLTGYNMHLCYQTVSTCAWASGRRTA